ncbi:MAG: RlmE family RNA methyltransferase [Desulfovibrio sp.]|nr:MAG: RlmE family RNA methyltransferase [Desulfovibrio sp.]
MKKYRDHYFKQAKKDNYPARSVYKLKEIDKKLRLLRPGLKVVDLGAAPGSWTLFAAQKTGPQGLVLSADLNPLSGDFPPQVTFFQADVFARGEAFSQALEDLGPFDILLSDMAPKTTGNKFTDQARSMDLAVEALALAEQCLVQGGHCVIKIFMGPDVQSFTQDMRRVFTTVKNIKPQSSRAESKEVFLAGMGLKQAAQARDTQEQ